MKNIIQFMAYIICIIILAWIFVSTVEVWVKQKTKSPIYSKVNCYNAFTQHTAEMKVVECTPHKADDSFLVTVEDIRGNQYAYYDTEYMYNGWIIKVTMDGNQIIDAVLSE